MAGNRAQTTPHSISLASARGFLAVERTSVRIRVVNCGLRPDADPRRRRAPSFGFFSFTVLPAPLREYPARSLSRARPLLPVTLASSSSSSLHCRYYTRRALCVSPPNTEKAERAGLSFIVCDTRSVIDGALARSGHLHSFRGMPRMPILERSFNPHPARPLSDRPHRASGLLDSAWIAEKRALSLSLEARLEQRARRAGAT